MISDKTRTPAASLSRLIDLVTRFKTATRLGRSLTSFSSEELDRALISIGKSRGDLFTTFKGNAKHRRRLALMLEHFGVDRDHAAQDHWNAVRHADLVCIRCGNVRRCRSWLAWNANNDAPRVFCPNAALFDNIACQARTSRQGPAAPADCRD